MDHWLDFTEMRKDVAEIMVRWSWSDLMIKDMIFKINFGFSGGRSYYH